MNRPITIKIISIAVNIITCLVAVTIVLFHQNWFGKGDTEAFIYWTIPLTIGLAVSGQAILSVFYKTAFLIRICFIGFFSGFLSFSWVYCVSLALGPWIRAFSIPIFYLWIGGCFFQLLFLDWRLPKQNYKSKISKVILGLLSFPLILLAIIILMGCFSFMSLYLTKSEQEIYLIPQGYKGKVWVIYNQKEGKEEEYEGKKRIYRIPTSGILFTQFKDKEGIIDQEYYYISQDGIRKKIGVLDTRNFNEEWTTKKNSKEPPRDSLAVFNPGTMGTIGSVGNKSNRIFSELSIGTYNDVKNMKDFKTEYIDSLERVQ